MIYTKTANLFFRTSSKRQMDRREKQIRISRESIPIGLQASRVELCTHRTLLQAKSKAAEVRGEGKRSELVLFLDCRMADVCLFSYHTTAQMDGVPTIQNRRHHINRYRDAMSSVIFRNTLAMCVAIKIGIITSKAFFFL